MKFMKQAFVAAQRAFNHDDVPIGAVIVRDGKIIARGENQVQLRKNPTLHAEVVAINRACKKLGSKFLDNCDNI
ncbi:MAG: deaminase [Alphaproteobacteria bacterium]|nr:deaminase [Alphaproteobacteria bacterium]